MFVMYIWYEGDFSGLSSVKFKLWDDKLQQQVFWVLLHYNFDISDEFNSTETFLTLHP